MKILLTMNLPYLRSSGGANRSNRSLAEALAFRGHEVRVLVPTLSTPPATTHTDFLEELDRQGIEYFSSSEGEEFSFNHVKVIGVRDAGRLRLCLSQQLTKFSPDWVLVSSEDQSQNLLAAALEYSRSRVVYLAHTPQMLPFGPASLYPGETRADLVRQAAAVVAISNFVAEYVEQYTGRKVFVNHPPHYGCPPFENYGSRNSGYVLMMNPCAVKGISIFCSLAEALPQRQFAAVPGYGTTRSDRLALSRYPNIKLLENSHSLDDILSQARLVLMPSLWAEGFGMTAVDAMLRGIPVLAANCGGLLEAKLGTDFLLPVRPIQKFKDALDDALLPAPVVPEQDIRPWQDAVERLVSDDRLYRTQSSMAREASSRFVKSLSIAPLEKFLMQLAERPMSKSAPSLRRAALAKGQASVQSLGAQVGKLTPEQQALLILRLQKQRLARDEKLRQGLCIQRASREQPTPLSFAQQRLWLIDQLEPGGAANNLSFGLRLKGALDKPALQSTLNEIVRRHEILRTRFPAYAGVAQQDIIPDFHADVEQLDLRIGSERAQERHAQEIAYREWKEPFELERGPMLRVKLLQLGDIDHVLLVTMHHVVSDGWSLGVMINEFATLYPAFAAGQPSPLPELPIQYADFAVWERETLSGDALKARVDYWRDQLEGATVELQLPQRRKRPAVQSFRGTRQPVALSRELAGDLRALSRQSGSTLFMTVLGAFAAILHQYTGQEDVVIGSIMANRDRAELEKLIGFLANTLVLRVDFSGDPSFRDLLGRVRETCLQAYAHQLPPEKLVEELARNRGAERQPLYEVWFQLDSGVGQKLELPALEIEPFQAKGSDDTAKFELSLELSDDEQRIVGHIEYDTGVFNEDTITQMIARLQILLEKMVADPEQRLSAVSLASEQESLKLVSAFSGALEE